MAILLDWKPPRGRVLVLAPHPDDETIGCGGTLLLHRRQGDAVKVVFATDGMAGDPKGLYHDRDYRTIRQKEARRANAVLGVSSLEFWDYPDGALAASAGLTDRLADLLKKERPEIVYLPSKSDPHPDHKALAAGFDDAARRTKADLLDCRYEVWSMLRPRCAADISAVFPKKLSALRHYRSQLRYHDYRARVTRLNASRSLLLRESDYAEAFEFKARGESSIPRETVVPRSAPRTPARGPAKR